MVSRERRNRYMNGKCLCIKQKSSNYKYRTGLKVFKKNILTVKENHMWMTFISSITLALCLTVLSFDWHKSEKCLLVFFYVWKVGNCLMHESFLRQDFSAIYFWMWLQVQIIKKKKKIRITVDLSIKTNSIPCRMVLNLCFCVSESGRKEIC